MATQAELKRHKQNTEIGELVGRCTFFSDGSTYIQIADRINVICLTEKGMAETLSKLKDR